MTQIDVRVIQPRDRHPLIFRTFDNLQPGESFELINDHAPKPLYYQFLHERTDQFEWVYLEEGPETWRVRITRTTMEH
ncbi:MAG: DUF2249 domain-containing protein [Anaerolineae bacterium]|nr:DUF2249 domain-containing protein [Anaerolineae bacterium]